MEKKDNADSAANATLDKDAGPSAQSRELAALLDAVFEHQGVDFRDYAYSSLKRRVDRRVVEEGTDTIAGLKNRALEDPACMDRLLNALTVHATAMYRDPSFYLTLREKVLPSLRTYPFLRLWVAGCSTGEEVYSLAILLHEANLYSRCRIYATDVRQAVLDKARAGIFPLSAMQDYTQNYQKAGGSRAFAEYYTADSEFAVFRPFLRENVVFAIHNLASDASFNEFQAIFCRNVMIYFNRALQARAHRLLYESLITYGYLGLGSSETVRFSDSERFYEAISVKNRIFRKIT